jgi:hypothetical protein
MKRTEQNILKVKNHEKDGNYFFSPYINGYCHTKPLKYGAKSGCKTAPFWTLLMDLGEKEQNHII